MMLRLSCRFGGLSLIRASARLADNFRMRRSVCWPGPSIHLTTLRYLMTCCCVTAHSSPSFYYSH
eukprot:scaffold252515_cov17-Prasinocladus_malaysianus.AAC.1